MSTYAPSPEHAIDLSLAAALQSALLPQSCPGNCEHQALAARNRMCGSVGGDFYDFISVHDEQLVVIVGDVVGHGVRGALIMARIMGYLHSRPACLARPAEVIRHLNRMLIDLGDRSDSVLPVSLFYALFDAPTGVSFFVNAGCPRPFLCDRQACYALHLGPRNLVLGVEDYEPAEGCHTFTPGQRLVICTDGLADAVDEHRQPFGERRLHEMLHTLASEGPDRCAQGIFDAVAEFRGTADQSDDETIVVIDRL